MHSHGWYQIFSMHCITYLITDIWLPWRTEGNLVSYWRILKSSAKIPQETEEPLFFLPGSTIVSCDFPQIARKLHSLCLVWWHLATQCKLHPTTLELIVLKGYANSQQSYISSSSSIWQYRRKTLRWRKKSWNYLRRIKFHPLVTLILRIPTWIC